MTTLRTIDAAQRTAAKVVGFLYLFTLVTANFAEFYARGRLIVPSDAAQTASNITASERIFRLGTVSDLITFAGCCRVGMGSLRRTRAHQQEGGLPCCILADRRMFHICGHHVERFCDLAAPEWR